MPKPDLLDYDRLVLHDKLTKTGDIEYEGMPYCYSITEVTLVAYHTEKLRILFSREPSDIKESIMFLIQSGMSIETIRFQTGISQATFYRYLKSS